jgi:hypothetical protein
VSDFFYQWTIVTNFSPEVCRNKTVNESIKLSSNAWQFIKNFRSAHCFEIAHGRLKCTMLDHPGALRFLQTSTRTQNGSGIRAWIREPSSITRCTRARVLRIITEQYTIFFCFQLRSVYDTSTRVVRALRFRPALYPRIILNARVYIVQLERNENVWKSDSVSPLIRRQNVYTHAYSYIIV